MLIHAKNNHPAVLAFCLGIVASPLLAQGIRGPSLVSAGSTTVYTFRTIMGVEIRDVRWTVLEDGGGTISDCGLYHAPLRPGTYTLQATALRTPPLTTKYFVNVKSLDDFQAIWEINGRRSKNGDHAFDNASYFFESPKGPLLFTPSDESTMELTDGTGNLFRAPCFYTAPDNGVSWVATFNNSDELAKVNRMRILKKGAEHIVLLDRPVDGHIPPQWTWEVVPLDSLSIKFRLKGNEDVNALHAKTSWDEGHSWDYQTLNKGDLKDGWVKLTLASSLALQEVPHPLIELEVVRGFNRRAVIYRWGKGLVEKAGERK